MIPHTARGVLCLSGHDPSGGAGIQADIEAITAQNVHPYTVITALTVQDTQDVRRVAPVDAKLLAEQLELLLADAEIHAIKIGLLGGADQLPPILNALARAAVPVVVDPVLRAGGGGELAAQATAAALRRELLPATTVLTPNAAEARRLAGSDDLDACGAALLDSGCAHVLITGGDEQTDEVENRWYRRGAAVEIFRWPRWPGGFHGAGCTLASAIAARLALGEDVAVALQQAQRYVHGCLGRARRVGRGRPIPGRT